MARRAAKDTPRQEVGWQAGWILQPDQLLVDNYRILDMIGSPGGMGQVYAAEDLRLEVRVAIKVPALNVLMSLAGANLFLDEARKAAQLRPHPHIVLINACLTDPKLIIKVPDEREHVAIPFIVMEYLGGGDLAQRLIGNKAMDLSLAVDIFTKICSAVEYAHKCEFEQHGKKIHGLLHRDLKPQNICFDAKGRPVVVDFGLARLLEDPSSSGGMKGTPTHMAPEQWNPSRGIDHRTDIYALGVILYQMVTGHLPFDGLSMEELMSMHLFTPTPDPRRYKPDLPDHLVKAIFRSMEKEKNARFESVAQFAEAVKTIEISYIPEKPPEKSQEPLTQRCPHCQQTAAPEEVGGKLYCSNCGKLWDQTAGDISDKEPFTCANCGFTGVPAIVSGVAYCQECGVRRQPGFKVTPVNQPEPGSQAKCPTCGATGRVYLSNSIYCENCGRKL